MCTQTIQPVYAVICDGHEIDAFFPSITEARAHAKELKKDIDSACTIKLFDNEDQAQTWIENKRGY